MKSYIIVQRKEYMVNTNQHHDLGVLFQQKNKTILAALIKTIKLGVCGVGGSECWWY